MRRRRQQSGIARSRGSPRFVSYSSASYAWHPPASIGSGSLPAGKLPRPAGPTLTTRARQDRLPSYDGRGLLNLAAELELRLTGRSPAPGAGRRLGGRGPGGGELRAVGGRRPGRPPSSATPLRRRWRSARRGVIDAPFPTTTTVSLSSLVTTIGTLGARRHRASPLAPRVGLGGQHAPLGDHRGASAGLRHSERCSPRPTCGSGYAKRAGSR